MAFFNLRQKVYICIYKHFDINKIHKSKKAGQLLLWIWINRTKWVNEWFDKEPYLYWIFSVGSDSVFTKNKYSWISHTNLAIWWWSSSKISSSAVADLCLFLQITILSWTTSTPEFFFSCFSNNKKKLDYIWLYTIDYIW